MRVLYPMSARIAEFINDEAQSPAGIMMVWSAFCIALLVLVLSALPTFEVGSGGDRYGAANTHFNPSTQLQHTSQSQANAPAENQKMRAFAQEYIDAHKGAQSLTNIKPVAMRLPSAAPAKQPASAGQFL